MSIAKVKEIGKNSKGGPIVIVEGKDGDWKLYPERSLSILGIVAGLTIDFEWEKKTIGDKGGSITVLKSWKASAEPVKPLGGFKPIDTGVPGLSEPALRFISNVVGCALTAKSCANPQDVKVWSQAALEAFELLKDSLQPKAPINPDLGGDEIPEYAR